ncbi:MAG: site-2 protease family protein, partial [Halanaerobiales bacterium]
MLLTIVSFVLVLGLLIFVHEFGHFITAKKSDIRVEEFALGFGPRLFSRQKGETIYSLRAIPLGGFC